MESVAQLFGEHGDEEREGSDDALVVGQWMSVLDGFDTLRDESGLSHIVLVEEAFEGGAACLASGFEGGPLLKEVAEEVTVLVRKTTEELGGSSS